MKTFLKTHLIGSAREKNLQMFNKLIQFLSTDQLRITDWTFDTEDIKEIIHYKTFEVNSLFSKTALNVANENNERFMALELLKLEQTVHSSEMEGQTCLHENLSRVAMLTWIIESFSKFYVESASKRWFRAFITVFMELVLLSYVPFMYDMYSDISLAGSYYQFAYVSFNDSEVIECSDNQFNFSCYRRTSLGHDVNFENNSFDTTDQLDSLPSSEDWLNLRQMFKVALWTTCTSFSISLLFYFYSIIIHPNPKCLSPVPYNKTSGQQIENKYINCLQMVAWCLCQLMLGAVGKLLWPIIHIWRRMQYQASLKSIEHSELRSQSDQTWKNIKAVEYGVESSIQLLLQLWLLKPFLYDISVWRATEFFIRCVTGVANFVTFDIYPACYIEKALGKIFLTVISLTLGLAQTKSYIPGQGFTDKPLKTVPIFVSLLAQTIARIFAFKSLILLEYSSGFYIYAIFFATHYAAVFAIKILFEIPSLKTKLKVECYADKETFLNFFRFIASGLSSVILMIHLRKDPTMISGKSGKSRHTFLSHTFFFFISLVQNWALVTLPYTAPHLYPDVYCFTTDSRTNAVGTVVGLWFVGVIAQIIHYKWAHNWRLLNGPHATGSELEIESNVPWSKRSRRLSVSRQGFQSRKIRMKTKDNR